MKLIDSVLYIEFSDAIDSGISEGTLKDASSNNRQSWSFIDDPTDGRKRLIEYEKLKDNYKQKIISRFGNPYEHIAKEPIRKMVSKDLAAEKFYFDYRFDGGKTLPLENIKAYTAAASWLNMLVKAEENKKEIKKLLGLSITDFWIQVGAIISNPKDKIDLPANCIRLRQKIADYKVNGYATLIHKQFGNDNAKKVKGELLESLLLELIAMPNQNDIMTARRYNKIAVEKGEPQITDATVGNWRRRNKHLISAQKFGVKETYNEFGKHIQRKRPSAPLVLVEHDDNELDLYFQSKRKKNGRTEVYYFDRFVLAVVIDAYNDYILGWAIAPTYTKELIRFAYLDAVHHIKELAGDWYLPNQIRCDHFGVDAKLTNDLAEFYKSLAVFTPATVKVARGKYIERSFGKVWHSVLSCYDNYAGPNVTAKGGISEDFADEHRENYPTSDKAPQQAAHFISIMRNMVDESTGLSKQEQWIKAFNESDKSKKNHISETQMLLKLGERHIVASASNPLFPNKISNRGITPTINCIERTYEIPEEIYLQTIGRQVGVVFDKMDYSRILVIDNEGQTFIAKEIELMPSAILDYEPGDRKKINDRLEEKVRHNKMLTDKMQTRQDVLQRNGIEVRGMLQAGVHTKEINHNLLMDYRPSIQDALPAMRNEKNDLPYDPLDAL